MLFVPGDDPRKLEKARSLRPDAWILDLEDGVAPSRKEAARARVAQELDRGFPEGPTVWVRVNNHDPGYRRKDLEAICRSRSLDGICLPKSQEPDEVAETDHQLALLERASGRRRGTLALLLLIETARGFVQAFALAQASRRVAALIFGAEDYCGDLGVERSATGEEIAFPRAAIPVIARAAGVLAIDMIHAAFEDLAGLRRETRLARRLGYTGKLVIHPAQIPVVHRAMAPTLKELREARQVLHALEEAETAGSGIAVVGGKMVDEAMRRRALLTVASDKGSRGRARA